MNLRNKKGAISIFVLVMLLFMTAFLLILYANNVNKSKVVKEQFNIISDIYAYGGGEESAYNKAYADLRKKNKQTLKYDSLESGLTSVSEVELTKTFEDKISNYRIYGTAEGVGDEVNLFDINSVTEFIVIGAEDTFENGVITTKEKWGCECNPGISELSSGSYILSADMLIENESDEIEWIRMGYRDANKTSHTQKYRIDNFEHKWTRIYYQFTLTEDIGIYSFIFGNNGMDYTVSIKNIQLRKVIESEIMPTKYEPCGKYKININTISRNLFNIDSVVNFYYHNFYGSDNAFCYMATADSNSSLSNISDGIISNLKGFWAHPIICNTNVKKLEAGTYTLSAEAMADKENGTLGGRIGWWENGFDYSNGKEFKLSQYKEWEKISYTFTITEDVETMGFLFQGYGDNKVENFKFRNIQLEKGDTATQYQENNQYEIYINSPLYEGDYIDFKSSKVVRSDGTEEYIDLPELSTYEDYTKIEVLTEVKPSRIEVEYTGYTLEGD